jgi:hypothetical protein
MAKRMTLDDLVAQLRQAHGSALQAVVLYGSAATADNTDGHTDMNVMLIASEIRASQLHALGQTMRAWQEAGNPPVLELTTDEWLSCADIFPMEYADIFERHRVVHGTLPLDGVRVRIADLRLQVEQEAMGKLLRLRRSIAVAGTDAARQQELLKASIGTLLVIFRSVLRLQGVIPPRDSGLVIDQVATNCGFDASPFRTALTLRAGGRFDTAATEQTLDRYLDGMTAVVSWLDDFTPTDAARELVPGTA